MNVETMTAPEIDAELATLWERERRYRGYAASQRAWIDGERMRHEAWQRDGVFDEQRRIVEARTRIADYEARVAEARTEAAPYEAEFTRRGGWNRYFLVTNTNGHVHRGMNCTTCYDDTHYRWLVELADCNEKAMVDEWGMMACTVCFPHAPRYLAFKGEPREVAEAKAQRAADKAEKAAKRAAKALFADDPERGIKAAYDTIRTIAAAKAWLTDAAWYDPGHPCYPNDMVIEVATALAVRSGTTVEAEIDAAEKRAAKRK